MLDKLKQKAHSVMVICGCMLKVEMLVGIAEEVPLEVMTQPESLSKFQINYLAVGVTKPTDPS